MKARIGSSVGKLLALAVILQMSLVCSLGQTNAISTRSLTWAVKVDKPGLLNFYQVSTNFYRGAQPSTQGIAELRAIGIKTVLNLRSFHSDNNLLAGSGFKQARLHMKPWHAEDEDVVEFLKVVTNTNNLPVFVHCLHGSDRTGMVCAMYRVVVCGWTKEAAIEEMKQGGFNFNRNWKNLVRYIEQADVEKLKRRAGLSIK
jgi:protein tyrosine/serine phosphatase